MIITTDTTRDYLADIASANDGDTVLMRSGTYAPAFVPGNLGFFVINKAITLENYPGETPVLTYSGVDNEAIIWVYAGATFRGLSIVGTYDLGASDAYKRVNILVSGTALITVDRCTLTKYAHCGIKAMSANTPLLVQLCEIGQGGYSNLDHGIYIGNGGNAVKIFRFNNIHHATGAGIHIYSYEYNCIVYGNVIHHNPGFGGYGILVTGDNHVIANNTISGCWRGLCFFHYGLSGLTVKNNIVYGNTDDLVADIGAGEGFTGCSFGYNDYGNQSNVAMVGAGDITSDPLFLGSTTWLDYRLNATSPCRDAGTLVAGVTTQEGLDPDQAPLTAKVFGVGYDIGAFVYTAIAPAPAPAPVLVPMKSHRGWMSQHSRRYTRRWLGNRRRNK